MKTSDFHYELPSRLIAQEPLAHRASSRLLLLSRTDSLMHDRVFKELPELLRAGDRLVLNDTRVIPARLLCKKENGAGVELLLTRRVDNLRWQAIARPARRVKKGVVVAVDGDEHILLRVRDVLADGTRVMELRGDGPVDSVDVVLRKYGRMPLPPYIRRPVRDRDRDSYQTVYAREDGAVAAPTAGLHFTPELLAGVRDKGVSVSFVTLHVGIGTFRPVKEDDPLAHYMHEEVYELHDEAAAEIVETRLAGGRIVAVGTTVVRVLEHCMQPDGTLSPGTGFTRLMILPGYKFKAVDCLVTNFHLPRSTLIMLVCAFAGSARVLAAYEHAVKQEYRFYSYGDAMLIL